MSLDEYVDMYLSEIKIDLDSEKMFPIALPLSRALEYKDMTQ